MSGEWIWDDASIPDHETLYRHVGRDDPNKVRRDSESEELSLTSAAFKSSELVDGWSVFRLLLMKELGVGIEDIEESGANPRSAWWFLVDTVRRNGAGVVDQEDPALGDLGKAHALVRLPQATVVTKKTARALQNALIRVARPARGSARA